MLSLFGTLFDDPRLFFVLAAAFAISFVLGLSFHEFSHALVGDMLGDPTPRSQGRLTLNPGAHIDPIGAMFLVLAGFGWAKPVQVNPNRLKLGRGLGMVVVAFAGPLSNFLLAAALAVPLKTNALTLSPPAFLDNWSAENYLAFLLFYMVLINTFLGVFNLLPLAPLDGSRVTRLLPGELGEFFEKMEPYGIFILLLLLFIPRLAGPDFDIIRRITDPINNRLLELFLSG